MSSDRTTQAFTDAYSGAVKFYGRHLVCLTGSYVHLDEDGKQIGTEQLFGLTGFVMSFFGEWFFVTAGHALKEGIDEKVATGRVKLLGTSFQDDFGLNAKTHLPTMFDYASAPRWYVDDRGLGIDVGLIYLREFYRKGLESNGVVPIPEKNWTNQPPDMDADYLLFGVPENDSPTAVEPGPTGEMLTKPVTATLLYVTRTDTPHRELPPSEYPWFIGTVNTEMFGLKSIVGMSGGPIFGYKLGADGNYRYWVVALQSWWDKDTRTVYGCPVPIFGRLVAAGLAEAFAPNPG